MVKNTVLGAVIVLMVSQAFAGGIAEPISMKSEAVTAESQPSSSSANLIIPLILIALVLAAINNSNYGASDAYPNLY